MQNLLEGQGTDVMIAMQRIAGTQIRQNTNNIMEGSYRGSEPEVSKIKDISRTGLLCLSVNIVMATFSTQINQTKENK
jgi:hypothetical protein